MVRSIYPKPSDQMKYVIIGVSCLVVFLIASLVGQPLYNVWVKELQGKAQLKEAEWNRQIFVKEAEAKQEAAKALAAAEVERARGVAKANQIIGESLRENEAYLRYLWIQGLQDGNNSVIYVPTETNLPVLEASRFNHLNTSLKSSQ